MNKGKPPFVTSYRDRHRKVRWRFRRRGFPQAQTALPFPSKAWWEWYEAACNADAREIGAERSKAGTFNSLIAAYYSSADFKLLSPATRKTLRGTIERWRQKNGEKRVKDLQPNHIKNMLDAQAEHPAAANSLLKALRKLMAFAKDRNWRSDDPAEDIRRLRYKTDGYHTWTEGEIAAFEARWALGTKQRLAFDLLLYTGQRSGDVRQMAAGQIQDGLVSVKQEKTGAEVTIPVHSALRASLDACPSGHLLLLPTQYGGGFTAAGFGNFMRDAAKKAGLANCPPHGLRKAAATRLSNAGASAHEIMAITGHQSLSEVTRYTRAADQKSNAKAAMDKVEKTQRERKIV